MRASIIQIGNSKGIRIPKGLLRLCAIGDEVDLDVKKGVLVITPVKKKAREGWQEAFAAMRSRGEDALLIPDSVGPDMRDWEW